MRRIVGVGIAIVVAVGAIVGLAGQGGSDSESGSKSSGGTGLESVTDHRDAVSGAAKSAPTAAADSGAAANAVRESIPAALPALPTRVVKHARVDLRVRGGVLDARVRAARDAAESAGGYVEQTEQSRGTASITLRVPAVSYAAVVDAIEHLGRVTSRSEQGEDVTAAFTDLEARLRNLRAQEAVLQDLMRQARSIADTITVQQQLSGVREQIEQLTGQQQLLDGQSSLATIAVGFRVHGVAPTPAEDRSSLGQAWTDAVDVMVAVAGGIVIVIGALVPFAVLALLGLAVWAAVRRRRPHLGAADA
jgi:hypothetical protein